MQSAMLNARLCFIFSSQLHVSMHQNVDATNIDTRLPDSSFHPTWARGLRERREPLLQPASLVAGAGSTGRGISCWPGARAACSQGLPAVSPGAHARSSGGLGASGFWQGGEWPLRRAGRAGRGARVWGHVTDANMAAHSGLHLFVRRGKFLEVREGSHRCSLATQSGSKGYTSAIRHLGVPDCVSPADICRRTLPLVTETDPRVFVTCLGITTLGVASICSPSLRFMGHYLKFSSATSAV